MPDTAFIRHSLVAVISDLHVGDPENPRLEDFDRDADLGHLIDVELPRRAAGDPVTLVIAGDFIDFPQVLPELDWHSLGDRIGVSEDQSLAKMKKVIAGHPDVFAALGRHIAHGGQILVLPGNHDVDLYWPSVFAAMRTALGGACESDLQFLPGGVIRERGMLIEHGNQYTYDNRFEHWGHPIVAAPDGPRLERPWGTMFMDLVYNDIEAAYPFINKVYPHGRMAWIALRSFRDEERVSVAALGRLVAFFAGRGKRMALEHLMGGEAANTGAPADPAAQVEQLIARMGAGGDRSRLDAVGAEALRLLKEEGGGAKESGDESAPAGLMGRNDDDTLADRALDVLRDGDARVVAFGHTHTPIDGNAKPVLGSQDARRAFNTGSWIPRIPLGRREEIKWADLKSRPWEHDLRYLWADLRGAVAAELLPVVGKET